MTDHSKSAIEGGRGHGIPGRVPSLTGLRGVAALLVLGTHSAFATGMLSAGYAGAMFARLEIGVPIFFVLSGFLLFQPWVRAAATASPAPDVGGYSWRRARRVLPAYFLTVMLAYAGYAFWAPDATPGQSWAGLIRHLTLTQIYTDDFLITYFHHGLSQTWSLAVEVSFYAALPALAYLLIVVHCRARWWPSRLLGGLALMAAVSPVSLIVANVTDWLPNSAGMWLPAHLIWFAGGMLLATLEGMGVRCPSGFAIPLALVLFLIACTPLAGSVAMGPVHLWEPLTKNFLYGCIGTLVVAPLALGGGGWYERMLGSRPIAWLGEISYEFFLLHVLVMTAVLEVLGWPLFTGSLPVLFSLTLCGVIPPAMGLRRLSSKFTTSRKSCRTFSSA